MSCKICVFNQNDTCTEKQEFGKQCIFFRAPCVTCAFGSKEYCIELETITNGRCKGYSPRTRKVYCSECSKEIVS